MALLARRGEGWATRKQRWRRRRRRHCRPPRPTSRLLLLLLLHAPSLRGPEDLVRPRHRRADLGLGPRGPFRAPRVALRGARGHAGSEGGGAAPKRRGRRLGRRYREVCPLPRPEVPVPLPARGPPRSRPRAQRPGGPAVPVFRLPQPPARLARAVGADARGAAAARPEAAREGAAGGVGGAGGGGDGAAFCEHGWSRIRCGLICCFVVVERSRRRRERRRRRKERRRKTSPVSATAARLRHLRRRPSLHPLRRAPLPPLALLLLSRVALRRGPGPRVLVRGEGCGHGEDAVKVRGGGRGGGDDESTSGKRHAKKKTVFLFPFPPFKL